jgi:hypothetical protein
MTSNRRCLRCCEQRLLTNARTSKEVVSGLLLRATSKYVEYLAAGPCGESGDYPNDARRTAGVAENGGPNSSYAHSLASA